MSKKKPPKVRPFPTPSPLPAPAAKPPTQEVTTSLVAMRKVVLEAMREQALDAVGGREDLLHLVPLAMAAQLADRMAARDSSAATPAVRTYAAAVYVLALIPPLQEGGVDLEAFTRKILMLIARLNEVSNVGK